MKHLSLYQELSDAFGPSGFEHAVASCITTHMKDFFPTRDSMQNVYTRLSPAQGKPVVMLDAHMDEVGFMIQSITANGLLKLVPLGGWVEHNVPAHTFLIQNTQHQLVRAVSSSKPPHFISQADRSTPLSLEHILLDAGVCSKDDAIRLGLEIGQPAVPEAHCSYDEATGLLLGKAFDCRLGCAGIIEAMHLLQGKPLAVEVVGAFSTQEEVGLRGAKVVAQTVQPALAICLEGTPADDTFLPKDEAQGVLKKGVQLRFRDGSMIAHPSFMAFARNVAQTRGIAHQCAVRTGGGTNAGTIHLVNQGIPTLVLGVPVRYAHTHYGYAAACDIQAAVQLACAIIEELTPQVLSELCPCIP